MAVSISLAITQNSQSIVNNTSNVTVNVTATWTGGSWNGTGKCTGSLTIDGTKYDFSGITFNTGRTNTGSQVIMTKTVNVAHGSDGKKTLLCSASFVTGVSSGTVSCSGSKALTTIARKSTLSVGNGTLNTAQTLTVTRQATSLTHTIIATCGSVSTTICTKSTSTSIDFTPPIEWASQNTAGTSVSVTYKITTYSGNTSIGSNSYTKTCSIPASVKPSCVVTVEDSTGYKTTYGAFIKGKSKFKVTVTPTLAYSSAIATYSTTANGATYTGASFTTGTLTSSGTLTVYATVKDERGRTGTDSETCTVLDYNAPKLTTLTVGRCDADKTPNDKGEYILVTFSGSVTNLNDKNVPNCTLRYKKSSEATYTVAALPTYTEYSISDTFLFVADTGSSYDVQFSIGDNFSTVSKKTSASTAFTLMHFSTGGTGIGIGKIAEAENLLDVGIPMTAHNLVRNSHTTTPYRHTHPTSGREIGFGVGGGAINRGIYDYTWDKWLFYSDATNTYIGDSTNTYAYGKNNVLWSGNYFMTAAHTVTLSQKVSEQAHGIVLIFSSYTNSTAHNYHFNSFFVPKYLVALHNGQGHHFMMSPTAEFDQFCGKYLYIHDTKIVGNDLNDDTGTGSSGITYNNKYFVLRWVIGV